jgi:pantothenate kinase-related protein Tda10
MRLAIQDKSAFRVKAPAFLCDRKIHEQIVSPLPDRPFFLAIIDSAGTGKTSMSINILSNK